MDSSLAATPSRAGQLLALRVLCAIVGGWLSFSGWSKLLGADWTVELFASLGYPEWLRLLVGVVEATGALLLLVAIFRPRLAPLGAALIAIDMIGVMATLWIKRGGEGVAPSTAVFLMTLAIIWLSRDHWPGRAQR